MRIKALPVKVRFTERPVALRAEALSNVDLPEIRKTKGVGRDKAIALKISFPLAKRMSPKNSAREFTAQSPQKNRRSSLRRTSRPHKRNLPRHLADQPQSPALHSRAIIRGAILFLSKGHSRNLVKIEVLDHIVIGSQSEGRVEDFRSLREIGHFYNG